MRWRRVAEGLRHSTSRDAGAISHHYDVSNRFYEMVLGPSMTYTCACYPDAEATLEQAQENKYRLVFDKLGLRPGDRLLDIGCGWGGMALYLARFLGAKVKGVTLSDEQLAIAKNRAIENGLEDKLRFELQDHNGKIVSSEDLLAKGRLVVCFIRGRWCPFCVGQMEAMNLILPQIEEAGAAMVAISPQTVKQSFFMRDQHKLRFPLLSDASNKVAQQFGLTYRVPAAQESVYKRAFVNLPFTNGDESWELPIPATYILDGDGTVLYASANEDYTERPEPLAIVARLNQALSS